MPAFDPRPAARRNRARKQVLNGTRPRSPDALVKALQEAADDVDALVGLVEQAARMLEEEQKVSKASRKQSEAREAQRRHLALEVSRLGRELREVQVTVVSARRLVGRLWEPDYLRADDLKRFNRIMGTRHRAGDYE